MHLGVLVKVQPMLKKGTVKTTIFCEITSLMNAMKIWTNLNRNEIKKKKKKRNYTKFTDIGEKQFPSFILLC